MTINYNLYLTQCNIIILDGQEISNLIWNVKVHYHFHKSLSFIPIWTILALHFYNIHLNVIFSPIPVSSKVSIQGFQLKFCMHF
jgi:hypothetical protein